MSLYIYILLIIFLFINIMSLGIIIAKFGEEKSRKFGLSDLIVTLATTVLFGVAVIKATGAYWG